MSKIVSTKSSKFNCARTIQANPVLTSLYGCTVHNSLDHHVKDCQRQEGGAGPKCVNFVVGVEPPGMLEVPRNQGPPRGYIYTEHDEKQEKDPPLQATVSDLTPQFNIKVVAI